MSQHRPGDQVPQAYERAFLALEKRTVNSSNLRCCGYASPLGERLGCLERGQAKKEEEEQDETETTTNDEWTIGARLQFTDSANACIGATIAL